MAFEYSSISVASETFWGFFWNNQESIAAESKYAIMERDNTVIGYWNAPWSPPSKVNFC